MNKEMNILKIKLVFVLLCCIYFIYASIRTYCLMRFTSNLDSLLCFNLIYECLFLLFGVYAIVSLIKKLKDFN